MGKNIFKYKIIVGTIFTESRIRRIVENFWLERGPGKAPCYGMIAIATEG